MKTKNKTTTKKLLPLIIVAATLLLTLPIYSQSASAFSGEGSGTEEDPYHISDLTELNETRLDLTAHYILENDIDASETENWNDGDGWEPIGEFNNEFNGSFDGQGYEINDLYIDRPNTYYVGLCGFTDTDSVVENVGLIDVDITGDRDVGGLLGLSYGTVSDSYATGSVEGGYWQVGGLVGRNSGDVVDSYSTADVEGSGRHVGGLVGRVYGGSVVDSYATGSVTGIGEFGVGGLVGSNRGASIDSSYATGNVESTGTLAGGIRVGGLVGHNRDFATVNNSYATGNVSAECRRVGGLVGYNYNNSIIENSYSTGYVEGGGQVGGLVGRQLENSSTYNSYWNNETSGQTTSDAGLGRTTAQMTYTYEDTYDGWDFLNTWHDGDHELVVDQSAEENSGYPALRWQGGLADTPWPSFGRDNKRTSLSPYDTSHVDGTEKWRYDISPSVTFSSPVVGYEDVIYVGGSDLYVVNPDGTEKCTFEKSFSSSSPALDHEGTVYTVSKSGENPPVLYAVNPDCTVKWSITLGSEDENIISSPAISSNGTVYIGLRDNHLYAINPDGTEKWSFETGDTVHSSPAIGSDGTVYVVSRDKHLYAISQLLELTINEPVGEGSVEIDGDTAELPYEESYPDGTTVSITADPDYGWEFGHWEGDITGDKQHEKDIDLNIDENKTLTPNFVRQEFNLTVDTEGQGSVTVNGSEIDDFPHVESYKFEDVFNITANSEEGWYFFDWSGSYDSTEEEIEIVMDETKDLVARFVEDGEIKISGRAHELSIGYSLQPGDELRVFPSGDVLDADGQDVATTGTMPLLRPGETNQIGLISPVYFEYAFTWYEFKEV